jgi:hypothetical protein
MKMEGALMERNGFAGLRSVAITGRVIFLIVLLTLVITFSRITTVHASPTSAPFWGPSGLGILPTTDTVAARHFEFGLGYERVKPDDGRVRFFPVFSATVGGERGEIGAAWVRERDSLSGFSDSLRNYTFHAKYRFAQNSRTGGAIAAGVHYLKPDDGHVTSFYLVGSQPLSRSTCGKETVRGHLGIIHHRSRFDTSENETRPMAGVDFILSKGVTLATDYAPRRGDASRLWSVMARYQAPTGWGGQIGVGKIEDDTKVFVSVTYLFSAKAR